MKARGSHRRVRPARLRDARAGWLGLCLGLACSAGLAQQARGLAITPTFSSSLTYTETGRGAPDLPRTDLVTELSPGLQITSRSGRVRGTLSYTLDAISHSSSMAASQLQNALNANFTAEAVPNWAYVDASATISQSSLSAYGQQSADNTQVNANRVEVGTVSISPYLKGAFGPYAVYEARLNADATNTRNSILGDSSSSGGSFSLSSPGRTLLGWGLVGTQQHASFRAGGSTDNTRLTASLNATPQPELTLTLRGGTEQTNVLTGETQRYGNWGAQAHWTPNERTVFDIGTDRRYYGQSYNVNVSWRTAQSSLRVSSVRDASTSSTPNGVGQPVTLYQQLYAALASAYPDPTARDQAVLLLLQQQGLDPNQIVPGGAITSAVTLQHREDIVFTYTGRRLVFTAQGFGSSSSQLYLSDTQSVAAAVRQLGYVASLSYRLTPTTSAALTGTQNKTLATSTQAGNGLKSLALSFSDQLGRRTTLGLSATYSSFTGPTNPYRQASISANLGLRF